MEQAAHQWGQTTSSPPEDILRHRSLQEAEFPVSDLSSSTIQRQRKELQLLMAELKDRDRELNIMAASHRKQLHAWEQDRQRALTSEQRCARLDDELMKRSEVIRVLTKRVFVVETREEEVQKQLRAARQELSELEEKQQKVRQTCEDFQEKNQSLSSTVMALSSQLGSLQVREEELSSMLKLKDKDVSEATSQIIELTGRLKDLETSLTESRSREKKLLKDSEENKHRHKEARQEITRLKEELQQQVSQSSSQREEIIRLKQELQLLRRDLALTGEGDSWRDELLELARSKQERTMSELRCLRQVCENQRSDLQLLQLNLENAREALRKQTGQEAPDSQEEFGCCCTENRSPSSLRARNFRLSQDSFSPPAVNQHRASNRERGGEVSEHRTDGEDPLSSRSLQELLDESRQVIQTASERGALDPLSSFRGQTSPHQYHHHHHHPAAPTHKVGETPPKACPPHRASRDLWMS
ncbi:coiled-coil domain-containing protein 62 isoform X2 [Halichoeres trimaculatus]